MIHGRPALICKKTSQDPPGMPELTQYWIPYVLFFASTYVPVLRFYLQIRHSKRTIMIKWSDYN